MARPSNSRAAIAAGESRNVEMTNSAFGAVYSEIDGIPHPVVDTAGYAPFGFGYRRCAGEHLTVEYRASARAQPQGRQARSVARGVRPLRDLPAPVEVHNQARVHLWFKQRFGADYPPLRCADESLTRYASIVHAVGVCLETDGRLDIIAPLGLDDLFQMVIRLNRAIPNENLQLCFT
jgi:hypothetical protein